MLKNYVSRIPSPPPQLIKRERESVNEGKSHDILTSSYFFVVHHIKLNLKYHFS